MAKGRRGRAAAPVTGGRVPRVVAVEPTWLPDGPEPLPCPRAESLREHCLGFGWGPLTSPPPSQQPTLPPRLPTPTSGPNPGLPLGDKAIRAEVGLAGKAWYQVLPGALPLVLLGPVGRGHRVIAQPGLQLCRRGSGQGQETGFIPGSICHLACDLGSLFCFHKMRSC